MRSLIKSAALLLVLGLAACSTPREGAVPPWVVGHAGPPFPYNSPWCP